MPPSGRREDMRKQEIIDTINELIEKMKEEGVQDVCENAFLKSIYSLENAVTMLEENYDPEDDL